MRAFLKKRVAYPGLLVAQRPQSPVKEDDKRPLFKPASRSAVLENLRFMKGLYFVIIILFLDINVVTILCVSIDSENIISVHFHCQKCCPLFFQFMVTDIQFFLFSKQRRILLFE